MSKKMTPYESSLIPSRAQLLETIKSAVWDMPDGEGCDMDDASAAAIADAVIASICTPEYKEKKTLLDQITSLTLSRDEALADLGKMRASIAAAFRHGWYARGDSKTNDIEERDLSYAASLTQVEGGQ